MLSLCAPFGQDVALPSLRGYAAMHFCILRAFVIPKIYSLYSIVYLISIGNTIYCTCVSKSEVYYVNIMLSTRQTEKKSTEINLPIYTLNNGNSIQKCSAFLRE